MKRKLFLFLTLFFMGIGAIMAQTQVRGTVVDEAGIPIIGATVQVKGSGLGVATDVDGHFSLSAPANGTLVISYVGLKTQEVPVSPTVNVKLLPDMELLDEVVVTAMGVSRDKKALGYNVQGVDGEELIKSGNPNIMTALSGKIAGFDVRQSSGMPGAPSQILIRGARAFSGNNSPLYVIDGMPISSESDYSSNVTGAAFSNRALDIDPNEIESINVLKGQAAAALYGIRASNGVIIITTKKGQSATGGRPVVTVSSGLVIDAPSRLPQVQQTYAQGSGGNFIPANSFSWGPKITDLPNNATYGGNNYAGHAGEFFDPYKGQWVTPMAYNTPKEFFSNNGQTFNNSVNVSNSFAAGNYSIGLSSANQTGIVKETGMARYTAKMAGEFKLTPIWNIGFTGNYSDINIDKLPSGNDSWLFTVYGAPASFDLMGTPYHQEGTHGQYRQISYRRGAVGNNPLWALANNSYNEKTKRFFGNMYAEFKPLNWVSVKYQLGVDNYNTDNAEYKEMGTGTLPAASGYPTPNNPVYAYLAPTGGQIKHYGVGRRIVNSLLTANFNYNFNEDIETSLMLGNEIDHNVSSFYTMTGSSFTTPGWNNMNNTNIQTADKDFYEKRSVGFFGNMTVDYKRTVFLNLTGRQDIVSSMPRGSRSFFYPSASMSFIFTELEGLKNQNMLSFGKFRAAYAEVGQAASTFYALPVLEPGGASSGFLQYGIEYPLGGVTGYKPSQTLYDPNLKPQNTQTVEVGLELRFLNDRLGIDYSFYKQVAKDQIFGVPLAGSTGYGLMVRNAGKMEGIGHEVIFTATPVRVNNFEWNFAANFSKINNKVLELAPDVESIHLGGYVTPNIRASAGDTYPAIYGEKYLRDSQGRILVDENPESAGYGMPLMGEFGKIGDVSPDFYMSFSNSFRIYKNISLSAQIDWKQGGQMYSGSNRLMDLYGSSARTEDRETPFIFPGYKANGQPNDIQRGGADDANAYQYLYSEVYDGLSEAHIYETSFVKLREAAISYTLPKKTAAALKMTNINLGFAVRNILLWTPLPNFDPEASQGQGNMQGGMDYMSLPQTTSYGFNLNLTF